MAQATRNGPRAESAPTGAEAPPRRRITKRKVVEDRARSYFEALGARDTEAMVEHWTEDGVADIVPYGILRGQSEIAAFFKHMFDAMPDLETSVERVAATAHLAAIEWRMAGHFTGAPFMDLEPTGRRIDIRGLDLLEIEDGNIVGNTAYYDGASFARQVGMLPSEGSGAERAMKGAFNAFTKMRRRVA
jgi:steroid delta-isomerase-like uncharacterized protein